MESKLLQHTIELSPVIRWNRIQVNFQVGRVKDKSSVVFESEVSHNVDGILKMTFTGIRKIG